VAAAVGVARDLAADAPAREEGNRRNKIAAGSTSAAIRKEVPAGVIITDRHPTAG
jgi:hypothetical protein